MNYDYILFWNSLWTIAPVIGLGLFDRFLGEFDKNSFNFLILIVLVKDAHVLMAVPELYRYGREGYWYSQKSFLIYMFDGLVQVSVSLRTFIQF
jgi:phospholipid-translocating ATPase